MRFEKPTDQDIRSRIFDDQTYVSLIVSELRRIEGRKATHSMQHWKGDTVPVSQVDEVLQRAHADVEHCRVFRAENHTTRV